MYRPCVLNCSTKFSELQNSCEYASTTTLEKGLPYCEVIEEGFDQQLVLNRQELEISSKF